MTAPSTPSPSSRTSMGPLTVIARIGARLAGAESLGTALPDILSMLAEGTGAHACPLRDVGNVTEPLGFLGDPLPSASREERWTLSIPLADSEPLGMLVLRWRQRRPARAEEVARAVGHLLVPALRYAHRPPPVVPSARDLEAERKLTESIIDALPVGLHVIDRDFRIRAWNRKRETGMQGIAREQAVGLPIFDVLHRQPESALRQEYEQLFETGEPQVTEVESGTGGEHRIFRVSKIPMRIAGGDITHVMTIGEDITDAKRSQEALLRSDKLAAVGTLAAGVMHEINNPLATIAACAESMALHLAEHEVDPATRGVFVEYVSIIEKEVQRCRRITDGMLDFSRATHDAPDVVDIHAVLDETLFLLGHHPAFRSVTVDRGYAEALPPVRGNGGRLTQLFMALLLNAADAIGRNGTATVRTRSLDDGRTVVIEVADQGVGIPVEMQERIWEPFFTTKPPGQGTGLGLAVSWRVVSDHGGRIEVASVPGSGSTFRVSLPAMAGDR